MKVGGLRLAVVGGGHKIGTYSAGRSDAVV